MQTDVPQPLSGVRVLDLGQIYQGPYATFLMAQAGADVVKVEPPEGEPARRREVAGGPASFPLAFLASNKRCVTLNLKSDPGRELLRRLVAEADVLLENFAPGVMDRLGVGAAALQQLNPRLVYASGTAFGLSGPHRDNLGMDVTVQAATGVMAITGEAEQGPLKSGPAVCDFLGGVHLYAGVVTALLDRERTGRGRLVEVAMQEATYPSLLSKLGLMHARGGEPPPRVGNRHGGVAPYDVYPTSDGHVAIICVTDAHWQSLARAMDRPELARDARFETHDDRVENLEQLEVLVQEWTRERSKDEVFRCAREHHVPCAPVRTLDEVNGDPHLHRRGFLQTLEHPQLGEVVLPASPIRYDHAAPAPLEPSHAVGADNGEVLAEWLGLSADEIDQLGQEGTL